MRPAARRAAGLLFAVLVTAAVVALSRVPWAAERGEHAELRLAWKQFSEHVEVCRPLSDEELERLPRHMRRKEDCSRALRPYFLTVTVDGTSLVADTVRATGARADRPLAVFRRLPLEPGPRRVQIVFAPLGARGGLVLSADTVLGLAARHVALVTTDERGHLVFLTSRGISER